MRTGIIGRKRGFTLVELLCAVGIIAVLAAIILPVVARASESARRSKCQSNLRQIGVAITAYSSDWAGAFPNTNDPYLWMGRRWRWPMKRYVGLTASYDPTAPYDPNKSINNNGGVLVCPSDPDAKTKFDVTSYGYSAAFYHTAEQINSMTMDQLWRLDSPGPACMTRTFSDVTYPSKKAIIADWGTNHSVEKGSWWDWNGARNYLFVDGHVRFFRSKQILPALDNCPDINLTKDGIHGKDIP